MYFIDVCSAIYSKACGPKHWRLGLKMQHFPSGHYGHLVLVHVVDDTFHVPCFDVTASEHLMGEGLTILTADTPGISRSLFNFLWQLRI